MYKHLPNQPLPLLSLLFLLGACSANQKQTSRVSIVVQHNLPPLRGLSTKTAQSSEPLTSNYCYVLHVTAPDINVSPQAIAACPDGPRGRGVLYGPWEVGTTAVIDVPIGADRRFDLVGVPKAKLPGVPCDQIRIDFNRASMSSSELALTVNGNPILAATESALPNRLVATTTASVAPGDQNIGLQMTAGSDGVLYACGGGTCTAARKTLTPFANTAAEMATGAGNSAANPFLICSKAQLDNIRNNYTLANIFFRLEDDINFAENAYPFVPINSFAGNFDGNGFKILNYQRSYPGSGANFPVGLFGHITAGGAVHHLGIVVSSPGVFGGSGDGDFGVLAGQLSGTVANCSVTIAANAKIQFNDTNTFNHNVGGVIGNAIAGNIDYVSFQGVIEGTGTSNSGWYNLGGIVGSSSAIISNSAVSGGSVAASNGAIGGMVGRTTLGSDISNSSVNLSSITQLPIASSVYASGGGYYGGLVGDFDGGSVSNSSVVLSGDINGTSVVGGFAGTLSGTSTSNSFVGHNVIAKVGAAGGFVGQAIKRTGTTVLEKNSAKLAAGYSVTGTMFVGGFVGSLIGADSVIDQSKFEGLVIGTVSPASNKVGGFVGYMTDGNISNSYTFGTGSGISVKGSTSVGRFGGQLDVGLVQHSYADTSVQSTTDSPFQFSGITGANLDEVAYNSNVSRYCIDYNSSPACASNSVTGVDFSQSVSSIQSDLENLHFDFTTPLWKTSTSSASKAILQWEP